MKIFEIFYLDSTLRDNIGIGASLQNFFYLDFGSAIEFLGTQLLVQNCNFRNNSGRMGGSIFIDGDNDGSAQILVETSIFADNLAYVGGALGFSSRLINLNALVMNCSFINNFGSSNYNKKL